MLALRILAAVAGVVLVAWALLSAIKTIVLPRAEASVVVTALFVNLRKVFDLVCSPKRSVRVPGQGHGLLRARSACCSCR